MSRNELCMVQVGLPAVLFGEEALEAVEVGVLLNTLYDHYIKLSTKLHLLALHGAKVIKRQELILCRRNVHTVIETLNGVEFNHYEPSSKTPRIKINSFLLDDQSVETIKMALTESEAPSPVHDLLTEKLTKLYEAATVAASSGY